MKKPTIPTDLIGAEVRVAALDPNIDSALYAERRVIRKRREAAVGVIKGVVPGYGGDVYWVTHDGDNVPYGYWELDLL